MSPALCLLHIFSKFLYTHSTDCISDVSLLDDIDYIENSMSDEETSEIREDYREDYRDTMIFNRAVREIFLNRFTQLFAGYEHFVIHPSRVSSIVSVESFVKLSK